MKNYILSLCFFLASSLGAEEAPTPDIQMDQLKHVKKQLAEAREQGWEHSAEKKDLRPKGPIEFNFSFAPSTEHKSNRSDFHPMQKSEQMALMFRSDIPESEKGRQMDRLNERDRNFKLSRKK
ncbi:MAG: hypothetical protein JSS10_00680 [Verrucomicrobia bacterium]|nr:hypothetical protein [Verrucomicrobiota bacterium]